MREKERTYGTRERRAFVRALPCCACGVEGFSQNAHVVKIDAGAGRKGSYLGIAPLCGSRILNDGCHHAFDEHRSTFYRKHPWFDAHAAASYTEAAWQCHLAQRGEE